MRVTPLIVAATLALVAVAAATACVGPADARGSSAAMASFPHDIALPDDVATLRARVGSGETLAVLLAKLKVAADDQRAAVARAASVFDLRRIRVGQPYLLQRTLRGAIRRFEYEIDGDRFLRVTRTEDERLAATILPIPKTTEIARVTGTIDRHASSLSAAMDAAGESVDLTLALADILGGEVDFSTEVQPGDAFSVTVEKKFRDGRAFAGYGSVLAVEFVNAGRRVRAVRFVPDGGQPGYYDERGVSMRRFFLASPLKFQPVVTSAFSRSRLHPILKEYRAHLGVDYRAPAGAPVVAVADGVVVSAAVSGGAGRLVHLRHANGYESEYLHLSSMTVRAGMRVHQGEIIGRVGSSGLATSAHLDYRLKRNGVFINPVTAHRSMPPADPVPSDQMAAFFLVRDQVFGVLPAVQTARRAND